MSDVKPEPIPETLIGFFWSGRRQYGFGLLFALSRVLVISPLPLIFKRMIDHSMPNKDIRELALLSGVVAVLLIAHQFISVQGATILGRAMTRMTLKLRSNTFEKIQRLSFAYLDRVKTGQLLSKYAFDTQKIDGLAMPVLNGFIPNTLYSLVTIGIFVYLDWKLTLVILLTLPLMAIMRSRYFQRLQKQHEVNRIAQEKLTGVATEYLGALRLVRSYGREKKAIDHLDEKNADAARSRIDMISLGSSFGAFSWAIQQFLALVVIAGGVAFVIYGKMTTGTVFAFVAGLPQIVQPIQMFANIADQYFLGSEAYRSVRQLLSEPEVERWQGTRRIQRICGKIVFDHVQFAYPGTDRQALSNFSLTIEEGQRVAFVGASGAGKSTAASLLLGLYAPVAGRIWIDGISMDELDVRWFRRQTALVMQESVLLSGSIADNIRFARDDATDDEVRTAAQQANALEFIERLPQGFDTVVGERGVMLSGGQRQRISIARAILRNPAILILDEPTSALDYESERLIQDAVDELVKGRTVITIAHRLSTIRNSDRIVVLSDGRIVEQGTFDGLMSQNGHFARMLASQHGEGGIGEVPPIHAA
ncbi:MAG: ABC transporter ATP-binding protein [Burkholderiales bacterium]|nr:ABC transporter ATP-binding protein [Phycisphaerae bacterium]